MITYCLPVSYDPAFFARPQDFPFPYKAPNAKLFFNTIANGDSELVRRIYEMIGYILSPVSNLKVFFLLQGESNSGKSVLGRFLEGFFPGHVTSLDISRLGGQYLPESLSTSCLNLSMDLPSGELLKKAIAVLEMLTGDDLITQEIKYKDARPYRGRCKFVFSTNHKLTLPNHDSAFLNRIVCIPFRYSVPADKRDPFLLQKLEAEREAIAMNALWAYGELMHNGGRFTGNESCIP